MEIIDGLQDYPGAHGSVRRLSIKYSAPLSLKETRSHSGIRVILTRISPAAEYASVMRSVSISSTARRIHIALRLLNPMSAASSLTRLVTGTMA